MPSVNFPNSPSNGQLHTFSHGHDNEVWQYFSAIPAWIKKSLPSSVTWKAGHQVFWQTEFPGVTNNAFTINIFGPSTTSAGVSLDPGDANGNGMLASLVATTLTETTRIGLNAALGINAPQYKHGVTAYSMWHAGNINSRAFPNSASIWDSVAGSAASMSMRWFGSSSRNSMMILDPNQTIGGGSEQTVLSAATLVNSLRLGLDANLLGGGLRLTVNGVTGQVWHAGNDGAASGLDADLLDGVQGAKYIRNDLSSISGSGVAHVMKNNPASGTIASGGTWGLEVQNLGSGGTAGAAFMCFHRPGVFAGFFGLDTDNKWKVGGFSYGANSYQIWGQMNQGAGTGMDADMTDGCHADVNANSNTLMKRDGSGNSIINQLFANYINQASANNENPIVNQIMVTNGVDNYVRKSSITNLSNSLNLSLSRNTSNPTPTAGSGSFTSVSCTVHYAFVGCAFLVTVTITITTNGTAGGWIIVPMPIINTSGVETTFFGRENAVTGAACVGVMLGSPNTNLLVFKHDNTYPGGNGHRITLGGILWRV